MAAPTLTPEVQELLKTQHVVRIGDTAPDFTAESQLGPINLFAAQPHSTIAALKLHSATRSLSHCVRSPCC